MQKYQLTHNYIKESWKKALREKSNPDYPLPYPFVPPCINGLFQCLFYWDTFYTNRGMILDGKVEYAKNNVDNLIYLLNKFGFIPNSNSAPGIRDNSQPPYLHFMIADIYNATGDTKWLKDAYFSLKKEYEFWMSERITQIGLNQYFHNKKTDEQLIGYYEYVTTRLDIDKNAPREEQIKMGAMFNCEGESGLDYSPRFKFDALDMVEVDLNSNLYSLEGHLAEWAKMFEPEMADFYKKAQENRHILMDKYLFNKEDGLYYDYNFMTKKIEQTEINFTGQFFPFIVGISKDKKACLKLLSKVEFAGGIASTNPYKSKLEFQAAYPFSWPYDNGLAYWGLISAGLFEDAKRVGYKYLDMCANNFVPTKHLWETYDALSGAIAKKKEYANGEMLGWTAGIYQWIYYDLEIKNNG